MTGWTNENLLYLPDSIEIDSLEGLTLLNTFTYFRCFLELFIGKFIPNINNEHAQDYSCPGATFAFCSHGEKLPRQRWLSGVVQRVTRLLKLPRSGIYRRRSCLMLITFDQPLFELFTLLLCGQSQLFKVETYCSRTGAYCYGVKTYYNQQ